MREIQNHLINKILPIVLILASVMIFLFSEVVLINPGIAPRNLIGWEFILGFQSLIGSVDDPSNNVTGLGFSFVLLLIPVFGILGIALLGLTIFKIDFKYSRVIIMSLFLLITILCLLPIQFANYYRVVEEGYIFVKMDSSEMNLYIGSYLSALLSFISTGIVLYGLFNHHDELKIN